MVKTLKLTIVLQFDLEKWNNQEPKKLQKKRPDACWTQNAQNERNLCQLFIVSIY